MAQLKILPAGYGDALLLRWTNENYSFNMLMDGGIQNIFKKVLNTEVAEISARREALDLVVTSHIDFDHITGILDLAIEMEEEQLKRGIVKQWWFNSGRLIAQYFDLPAKDKEIPIVEKKKGKNSQISLKQGVTFEQILDKLGNWHDYLITNDQAPFILGGAKFYILSPTREALGKFGKYWEKYLKQAKNAQSKRLIDDYDKSIKALEDVKYRRDSSGVNRSSIAFLWEFEEKRILFLADAVPEIYIPALKKLMSDENVQKLKVDYIILNYLIMVANGVFIQNY